MPNDKEKLPQRTLEFGLYPTRAQEQQLEAWLELQRRIWDYGLGLLVEREDFMPWDKASKSRVPACPIWGFVQVPSGKKANLLISKGKYADATEGICPLPQDHRPPRLDCSRQDKNPEYTLKGFFTKSNHPNWPELQGCPSKLIRGTLQALATAWAEYKKAKPDAMGRRRKRPRFKGVRFPITTLSNTDCKATAKVNGDTVTLPKLGAVRIRGNRDGRRWPADRVVGTYRIQKEPSGWFLLLVGVVPEQKVRQSELLVGLDAGVIHTLTTSTGKAIDGPRALEANLRKLKRLQQQLSRQKKGGANWSKTQARIARLHEKIRRTRKLFAHKTTTYLLRTYGAVVMEDLKLANMTRRPAPKPAADGQGFEPNQAAAKGTLNRRILDQGLGQLRTMLQEKGERLGREVHLINPAHTSQRCPSCGHVSAANRPSQALFRCEACGHTMNADHNAAINILRSQFKNQAVPMAPAPLQQAQAQLLLLDPSAPERPRRRRQPGPGSRRQGNQKPQAQLHLF